MDIAKTKIDVTAEQTYVETAQVERDSQWNSESDGTIDPLLLNGVGDWTSNSNLGEYNLESEEGNEFDYDALKTESKDDELTFEEFNLDAFPEQEPPTYAPVTPETKAKSKSEEEIALVYDGKNSLLNPLMVMVPSVDETPAAEDSFHGETEERPVVLEPIDPSQDTRTNSSPSIKIQQYPGIKVQQNSSIPLIQPPNSGSPRTSLPIPRLSCLPCNLFFNAQIDLDVHLMADHLYAFGCAVCLTFFANRDVLRKHEQSHWINGFRTCPFCSAKFKLKNQLMAHLDLVHPNRPKMFGCNNSECELLFGTMKELLRHKMTDQHYVKPPSSGSTSASNEIRWTWKCCGTEFKDHETFKSHFDLNHGSSITNINSETSLLRPSSAWENAVVMGAKAVPEVQSSIPPNMSEEEIAENVAVLRQAPKCEICDLRFVTLEGLENHNKKKHLIKFLCLACNEEFLTKDLLSNHTKLAHEQPKEKNTPSPRPQPRSRNPTPQIAINVEIPATNTNTAPANSPGGGGTVHWTPAATQPSMTPPKRNHNSSVTSPTLGEPPPKKVHLDDDLELACIKLRSWFKMSPNPSEAEIRTYAEELNLGNNRPNLPLTEAFLRQWFCRARRGDFSISGVLDTVTDPNKEFTAPAQASGTPPPNKSCVNINNALSSGGNVQSQRPTASVAIPNHTILESRTNGFAREVTNPLRIAESGPGVSLRFSIASHQPPQMQAMQPMSSNFPPQPQSRPSILIPQSQSQFLSRPPLPPYGNCTFQPTSNQQQISQPPQYSAQTRIPHPALYSGAHPGSLLLRNPLLAQRLMEAQSRQNSNQIQLRPCNPVNITQPLTIAMQTQNVPMTSRGPQMVLNQRYLNQTSPCIFSIVGAPPGLQGPCTVQIQNPGPGTQLVQNSMLRQQQSIANPPQPQPLLQYPSAVSSPQQVQSVGPPNVVGPSPGQGQSHNIHQHSGQLCSIQGLSLHPEHEIKRLIGWFYRAPYPTDETFERYARVLNLMPYRQQPNMFQLNSLIIKRWFQNICLKLRRRIPNDPNSAPQSEVPPAEPSSQPPQPLPQAEQQQQHLQQNNPFLLGQLYPNTLPPPEQPTPAVVGQENNATANSSVPPECATGENEQCSRVSSSQSPSTPAATHTSTCKATINKYLEIPKLIKWAEITPNPTPEQIEAYTAELNKSAIRKDGTLLPRIAVANFFKKLNYHRMNNPDACEVINPTVRDPAPQNENSACSSPEIVAIAGSSQLQIDYESSKDSLKSPNLPQEPLNVESNASSKSSEENKKSDKPEPEVIDLEDDEDIQVVHEKIIKQRVLPSQLFSVSRDSDFLGPLYTGPCPGQFKLELLSEEEKEMDGLVRKLFEGEATHCALRLILDKFSQFPHRITSYGIHYNTFRERLRTRIMEKANSKVGEPESSTTDKNLQTKNPDPPSEPTTMPNLTETSPVLPGTD